MKPHVIVTTFPAQGHINPALQFAKNLVKNGIQVTFSTSIYAQRLMDEKKSIDNFPKGLMNFVPFSDGFDDGFDHSKDPVFYMSQLRKCGSQTVKNIIINCSENGSPITCLLYSIFLPWAAEVIFLLDYYLVRSVCLHTSRLFSQVIYYLLSAHS